MMGRAGRKTQPSHLIASATDMTLEVKWNFDLLSFTVHIPIVIVDAPHEEHCSGTELCCYSALLSKLMYKSHVTS